MTLNNIFIIIIIIKSTFLLYPCIPYISANSREIDNKTADIITRGYVDDGLGGGRDHVVRKLIGVEYFNTEDEQSGPTPYLGVQESKAIAITPGREGQVSMATPPKKEESESSPHIAITPSP